MQRQLGSTAYHIVFLMVDSNDHVTAKTGLTPTVTLSKNGTDYVAAAGAVSEIANGVYKLAANATDLNTLGVLALHASATGADPVDMLLEVVSHDPFAIPASVWDNDDRTLTMTPAEVASTVTGTAITQTRGNDWNIEITGLTLYSTKIQFALKNSYSDTDADAVLFIDTTTGLITVNGAVGTAENASLTYVGTTLTVVVDAEVTALLPAGGYKYGIQGIGATGLVQESYGGDFIITSDVVRAVS